MGGGVGQGCPDSALLCLFVAGMLACGLRHNSEIRGVGVSDMGAVWRLFGVRTVSLWP